MKVTAGVMTIPLRCFVVADDSGMLVYAVVYVPYYLLEIWSWSLIMVR
jgi:hypothetical protein